ncbi:hypothetical protein QIS99_07625 [Streptomyces sp. B-S-A8]|uniref:Proteinase inhibitor I42 chagasin domain-containing protein n=1 Tax=Streptomyces solicavernae TaxID=3043614 RepID=A0ABT6RNT6_9ACTN|nr:hypothetical protein [Streptomyces sp. B-S-A8]MDI3386088.1 hypothetical protein [Streptomyces sp. B-S-A8]
MPTPTPEPTPEPTPKLALPRGKQGRWLAAGAALVVLGGGGFLAYEVLFADDTVCCALPPPLHNVPRGPDGEIDIASQSLRPEVLVGHDFSIHVRPGGDADDWRLAESGEAEGVVHARGVKDVDGTRYFRFRALKTGTARIVLEEVDGKRTMTYPVEVKEGTQVSGVLDDPEDRYGRPGEDVPPDNVRTLERDFDGDVTVRPGETFRIANHYDNQPGYTWQIVGPPDESVLADYLSGVHTTGDAATVRQDWYKFTASGKGTTEVKLFGCYRCTDGIKAETAESEKFSVTKTLTVTVR